MQQRSSSIKDFTRGGQTLLHFMRMATQVLKRFLAFVALVWVLSVVAYYWHKSTGYERYLSLKWVMARFIVDFQPEQALVLRLPSGEEKTVAAAQLVRNARVRMVVQQQVQWLQRGMWIACGVIILVFSGVTLFIVRTGKGLRKEQRLRGGQITTARRLAGQLYMTRQASDMTLAGVPLLKHSETSHLLIAGSPGSGKSLVMRDLLDGIRRRGDRAIVYSTAGEFIENYYQPSDTILNPLDDRCPPWNLWCDCQEPTDYDQLAASLIPEARSGDPFWNKAAQTLLSATAQKLAQDGNISNAALIDTLLKMDLETLAAFLHGTEAANLVEKNAEKVALSIRATVTTYLRAVRFLRDDSTATFSIRRWVRQNAGNSWIFLCSRPDQHTSVRPLMTTWMDIAAATILSQSPDQQRRIWIVIDELPSLNRLPSLSPLLAMGRKYGACGVLGFQSYAQLCDIYGRHGAEEIAGLCSTWVLYRANEPVTAEWCSKALGTVENLEASEGLSYGANEIRDGVNLNLQRQTRPLVLPSEMQNLPDRQGFIRLPGHLPVARFEVPYVARPVVAPGYVARGTQGG